MEKLTKKELQEENRFLDDLQYDYKLKIVRQDAEIGELKDEVKRLKGE